MIFSTFGILFLFQSSIIQNCQAGIFNWLFNSDEPKYYPKIEFEGNENGLMAKIPFEMKSEDENFIQAVEKFTSIQLSDLDVCHHKVIIGLKKSCSDLTEEDLAKTAVNLLNCQSAVEGRTIFPCTSNMHLYQCTGTMDQNTWNAYHIISNRVRAVCYHFRQQQFTAKTEMTINKLVSTADEQINSMKQLEDSQTELKRATSNTLSTVKSGHQTLKQQQEHLSKANAHIHNFVSSNIRDLHKEKRLIASGQKELADISLAIKRKLEEAQRQLKEQDSGQREVHQQILLDLSKIQENANVVWAQIEESTRKILLNHEKAVSNYVQLTRDLQKVNVTVQSLTSTLQNVKDKLEEKFSWISALLGDTDATVQKIYCFVLHLVYCLVGMIATTFLQVPYVSRVLLILLVPLNAVSEIREGVSLPFETLSLVLFTCIAINVISVATWKLYHWRTYRKSLLGDKKECLKDSVTWNSTPFENSSYMAREKENDRKGIERSRTLTSRSFITDQTDTSPFHDVSYRKTSFSPLDDILEHDFDENRAVEKVSSELDLDAVRRRLHSTTDSFKSPPYSRRSSLSSTPARQRERKNLSPSFTTKQSCSARCRNGLLCKNSAGPSSPYCHRHAHGFSREGTPVSN